MFKMNICVDSLAEIFKHLDVAALKAAALVSRTWCSLAQRTISTRKLVLYINRPKQLPTFITDISNCWFSDVARDFIHQKVPYTKCMFHEKNLIQAALICCTLLYDDMTYKCTKCGVMCCEYTSVGKKCILCLDGSFFCHSCKIAPIKFVRMHIDDDDKAICLKSYARTCSSCTQLCCATCIHYKCGICLRCRIIIKKTAQIHAI